MSNLMWRRKRELAEAWQSQSRSSSYLQMTWWLWVVLRQFWCHKHSIPVLTLEWKNEKIGFSNVKYNLGLLWVHPHVATHLVLHGVVCVLHCCCWLLVQTHHIIKRQVQVRSGGSQSWRVLIMTHLERMYLPFFFSPSFVLQSLGLWKKVDFFSDKSPQLDVPQCPSPSHGHPRAAVMCRLISHSRGRTCPSWPCFWQRHLGLRVREEWLVSPAKESCRAWLRENRQLTGDKRDFFPLRLFHFVLFFVMNQHRFSVLMFWFILLCAATLAWLLDADSL